MERMLISRLKNSKDRISALHWEFLDCSWKINKACI